MHKSRKTQGHAKTDIPLTSIMLFADNGLRMNTKNIVLHPFFDILYLHVYFHDLNAVEEV